jgi:hypothetical protein
MALQNHAIRYVRGYRKSAGNLDIVAYPQVWLDAYPGAKDTVITDSDRAGGKAARAEEIVTANDIVMVNTGMGRYQVVIANSGFGADINHAVDKIPAADFSAGADMNGRVNGIDKGKA